VREVPDHQPIMPAEGQIPADELAARALEELGDRRFPVLGFGQHALDCIRSELASRNIDGHVNLLINDEALPVFQASELYSCGRGGATTFPRGRASLPALPALDMRGMPGGQSAVTLVAAMS